MPGSLERAGAPVGSADDLPPDSIDRIYHDNVRLLFRIAERKFRVPPEDVEALVQDVFATYLSRLAEVVSVRAYLVGAICNACRQYWRNRDRHDALFLPADDTVGSEDACLRSLSTNLTVGVILSRLGSRCRDTLRRHYLDGEPIAAIADALGITPAYVRWLLHTCRRQARDLLVAMGGAT